jgi:hypothetical protein
MRQLYISTVEGDVHYLSYGNVILIAKKIIMPTKYELAMRYEDRWLVDNMRWYNKSTASTIEYVLQMYQMAKILH